MLEILSTLCITSARSNRRYKANVGLHSLECRLVPATYLWNPATDGFSTPPSLNWSTASNWDVKDVKDGSYGYQVISVPGVGDKVEFDANPGSGRTDTNYDCYIDVVGGVTIKNVSITNGFNKSVILSNPLTVVDGLLGLSSPGAAIRGSALGSPAKRGGLTIGSSSAFVYYAGDIDNVTVAVTSNSSMSVANSATNGLRVVSGSDIHIGNTCRLEWQEGNVNVTSPNGKLAPYANSNIFINSGGTFAISAAGGIWGMNTPSSPAYFKVINNGTVRLNATGTAAFVGDYTSSSLTRLNMGILHIEGKAEQTAGTFELRDNTTVKVRGSGSTLGIRGGSIVGQGTVDGNLVLGYDPKVGGGQGYGTINPGIDSTPSPPSTGPTVRGIGTITISQSFQIFNGGMIADLSAGGSIDKVVVQGPHAALSGSLFVRNDDKYNPLRVTQLACLTAMSISGDFRFKILSIATGWTDQATGKTYSSKLLLSGSSYVVSWYQTAGP